MAEAKLNCKFLRAFFVNPATPSVNGSTLYLFRVLYEFWGFCVNGTDDLRLPGGMATSHTTGSYINMPVGFETGSTVLLASGSDGTTFAGTTLFQAMNSQPFSASFKNKYITIWKSGSLSTDDSIYHIKEWINSSSIMIDPTYGGTVLGTTGSVPVMTSRENVNYRVIDYTAVTTMTPPTIGYFVIQFNAASDVNPGQRNSQAQISSRVNSISWDDVRVRLSPSGSWDGTQFVGSFENSGDITMDQNFGPGGGGWASLNWWHGGPGNGYITIIADKSFLIATTGGNWQFPAPSIMMIEVPKRLYPQGMDPNPICALSYGAFTVQTAASQGFGWASRYMPSPYDTTLRRYQGQIPCYAGGFWPIGLHTANYPQALNSRRFPVFYNQYTGKALLQSIILQLGNYFYQDSFGQPTIAGGKSSIARARLRSQKNIPGGVQRLARLDDGVNKWIHVGAGILFPWDNALVPERHLFRDF